MNVPSLTGVDVGSPRIPGATKQAGHDVEIVAGGADIWETRDEFHFAHTRISGDFVVTVRIDSLTLADLYTKAGLMLRASLEAGAEHVYLLAFGDNRPRNNNNGGLEFQFRSATNGSSTGIYPPQPLPKRPDFPVNFPNVWLRVTCAGSTITAENSQDGRNWRTFSVHNQRFPAAAYLGLAVTSHNVNQTVKAVFSHFSVVRTG